MISERESILSLVNELRSKLDQDEFGEEKLDRDPAQIFTVTSGKGGVGKSHLVANLAIKLAQLGQKVLVIDADLGMANLDVILGLNPSFTLNDVVEGTRSFDEVVIPGPGGIDVIAGGAGIQELADLDGEMREQILFDLESLEYRYDIIIVDTGAGLSRNVLEFAILADKVLLVTNPEPTALLDAYGVIKALSEEVEEPDIHVVINRVKSTIEAGETTDRLREVARHFLNVYVKSGGFVYEDSVVAEAVRHRTPFVLSYPAAKASKCIEALAMKLLKVQVQRESSGGMKTFLGRIAGIFGCRIPSLSRDREDAPGLTGKGQNMELTGIS